MKSFALFVTYFISSIGQMHDSKLSSQLSLSIELSDYLAQRYAFEVIPAEEVRLNAELSVQQTVM